MGLKMTMEQWGRSFLMLRLVSRLRTRLGVWNMNADNILSNYVDNTKAPYQDIDMLLDDMTSSLTHALESALNDADKLAKIGTYYDEELEKGYAEYCKVYNTKERFR